jgi:hypothetical protein
MATFNVAQPRAVVQLVSNKLKTNAPLVSNKLKTNAPQ